MWEDITTDKLKPQVNNESSFENTGKNKSVDVHMLAFGSALL